VVRAGDFHPAEPTVLINATCARKIGSDGLAAPSGVPTARDQLHRCCTHTKGLT